MFLNSAFENSIFYATGFSLAAKRALTDSRGFYSLNLLDKKINRFCYNIMESLSATYTFHSVCVLINKSLEIYTWQKVIAASIIAMPVLTRGIAHFYSKKPLDALDTLDVKIGQWINIANIVTSVALLVVFRKLIDLSTLACCSIGISGNIALSYFLSK